jgi:Zn-dependent protease
MELIIPLISIAVFLYAVVLHEIAHGWVAYKFGDDTAKVSGRLSLNPLVHIDPIGSILVPGILLLSSSGFLFGWAKPVPVNPYRLTGGAKAYRWVTMAGIATNLCLAIISLVILRVSQELAVPGNNLGVVFFFIAFKINLILAIFNSLPFPGFDGWNFITTFEPVAKAISKTPLGNPIFISQYGLVVSIALIFLFMPYIGQLFNLVFGLLMTIFGLA